MKKTEEKEIQTRKQVPHSENIRNNNRVFPIRINQSDLPRPLTDAPKTQQGGMTWRHAVRQLF